MIHGHIDGVFSKQNEELSVYGMLEVLSAYLKTDNLSVIEKSGIALGVFNLVLVSCPDLAEENRGKKFAQTLMNTLQHVQYLSMCPYRPHRQKR